MEKDRIRAAEAFNKLFAPQEDEPDFPDVRLN